MADENKGMKWDDFDRMHVEDGKLYWDNKEVLTKQVISLRWYELCLATVAAIGTFISAAWPIALHFGWLGN